MRWRWPTFSAPTSRSRRWVSMRRWRTHRGGATTSMRCRPSSTEPADRAPQHQHCERRDMRMTALIERTAGELTGLLARGEVTAEQLTALYLGAIRTRDGRVKAFLSVDEPAALAQARAVD